MEPTSKTQNTLFPVAAIALAIFAGGLLYPVHATSQTTPPQELYQQGNFNEAYNIWSIQAESGDAVALFNLSTLYETGRGVDRDLEKARLLLIEAAHKNYAPALHNLALVQFEENRPDLALQNLENAAHQKFTASLYTLGKFHQFGVSNGVRPDLAFQYIAMAAKAGHIKAQYNLGKMYRDGFGVASDQNASSHWFIRAARQGNKNAQAKLVARYARGLGVSKDEVVALKWALVTGDTDDKATMDLKDQLLAELSVKEVQLARKRALSFMVLKERLKE